MIVLKLKPIKEKILFKDVIREMISKTDKSSPSSITIDIDGGITVENFRKIIDYTDKKVAMETKQKLVYIYGENIAITHCDRHFATACGTIEKIEIFSKGE